MRIVSLVPSATEILFALGRGPDVVGVSHECVYPPPAQQLPRVLRTRLEDPAASSAAIDAAVREAVTTRTSLYVLDEALLHALRPDVIVMQSLCDVCAIGPAQLTPLLPRLSPRPAVVALHPHVLPDVFEDIRRLGAALGAQAEAVALCAGLQQRLQRVQQAVAPCARPRVVCLEWLDPLMAAGHWVPEQITLAGGQDMLAQAGAPSRRITWAQVQAAAPEWLLVAPCGFAPERTRQELGLLTAQPGWAELPAVQHDQVSILDGPSCFQAAGPRLMDAVEQLASLFHPARG